MGLQNVSVQRRVGFERRQELPDLPVGRLIGRVQPEESLQLVAVVSDEAAKELVLVSGNFRIILIIQVLANFFMQIVAIAVCVQVEPNFIGFLIRLNLIEPQEV